MWSKYLVASSVVSSQRWKISSLLCGCQDEGGGVVEVDANGSVGHGKTHSVFIAVVEPRHDEDPRHWRISLDL